MRSIYLGPGLEGNARPHRDDRGRACRGPAKRANKPASRRAASRTLPWLTRKELEPRAARHRQGRVDQRGRQTPASSVTSLTKAIGPPSLTRISTVARGEMERTAIQGVFRSTCSPTAPRPAPWRPTSSACWFASMAYVAGRQPGAGFALQTTDLADATCGTIRPASSSRSGRSSPSVSAGSSSLWRPELSLQKAVFATAHRALCGLPP